MLSPAPQGLEIRIIMSVSLHVLEGSLRTLDHSSVLLAVREENLLIQQILNAWRPVLQEPLEIQTHKPVFLHVLQEPLGIVAIIDVKLPVQHPSSRILAITFAKLPALEGNLVIPLHTLV